MCKKRILYITTWSDLGGVAIYLLELIKGLGSEIEPYFIMNSKGFLSDELEKLGLKNNIFFVPMTNSILDIKTHINSNLQTLSIIDKVKPDIIHCNSMTGGIVGRICGFIKKVPVIFTAHGWTFSGGYSKPLIVFYKILELFLALLTKKIICVSEHDRQIALKVMPFFKDKLIMIHNGISDIPTEFCKRNFSENELKVVMITRFSWPKNPNVLILAVKELNDEGLNIKLDLFGYGKKQIEVENLIKECNCPNIKLKGIAKNPELILKNYDVYALISDKEGLPIGIIEAMRAGLPLLISDVGGCRELIKDNGYLVEKRNLKDLKAKLRLLYEQLSNLPVLGQNSRHLFEIEFTSKNMVGKTFAVL